jgi:hypothetical protein
MYVEIRSRLSATISASQEKRKFALEDVFWVPISDCSSRHSTSRFVTELRSEKLNGSESSSSDNCANSDWKRLGGHR